MIRSTALVFSVLCALMMAAAPARAQQPTPDPDRRPNLGQPDFTLVALPTTLRLPRFKSAFRITHRFGRPLGQGDFGDLVGDLFGLDSGALIGLEYRFGIVKGGQVGIHRTSNRTIEFFGQHDVLHNADRKPLNVAFTTSVEGTNNFRDRYTPSLGGVVSYTFGNRASIYADPMWVHNANLFPSAVTGLDVDTFMVGVGARLRIRPTVYVVGEVTPRVAGYNPNTNQGSFGIEKRMGGHVFQLNFSNGFGTTMGQVARGGTGSDDWYIGFNLTRKFF